MFVINDIIISEELLKSKFFCHLEACKGNCCLEGDFGAPLEEEEIIILKKLLPKIESFLTGESRKIIAESDFYLYYEEKECFGTNLLKNGACVFMKRDDFGIAKCGIEQLFEMGKSDFRKPISCHLYPVRIKKLRAIDTEALNYDRWDICSPACSKGAELNIRLFEFVKEALMRRYGDSFYNALEAAANHSSS